MITRLTGTATRSATSAMVNSPVSSPSGKGRFTRYPTPRSSTATRADGWCSSTAATAGAASNVSSWTTSIGGYRNTTAPLLATTHSCSSSPGVEPCRSSRSAMAVMPCGDRPLASTIRAPASSARWTASYTGGLICSYVAPTPSTHFSRVPSMSRATSWGRHDRSDGFTASSLMDRLEHLEAAEIRTQRLGDPHRAVLLLVGLEHGDDRPVGRAQGAVQRGDRLDVAVGGAAAGVQSAGLEVGAVGGGGELAIAALAGDPGFAVELPLGGEAQVARGDIDHPVAELQLVEELLLPLQKPLMLGERLL